jgi:hypothetical protein
MAKQKMVTIPLTELVRWVAMSTEIYMQIKAPKRLMFLSGHLQLSIMAPLPTEGYAMVKRLEKSGAIAREIKLDLPLESVSHN